MQLFVLLLVVNALLAEPHGQAKGNKDCTRFLLNPSLP
ncbi:unknown protein [Cronobacter turicensis z3032]|uniref:Uncharacterized protein n=1 Tax=Cronobacter turicensis (strain DSM 18703 / CCUG 55852 / LMG 23827 / z3032) TaxID=693216 RepID=C9Y0P7_CROTZ|nr:unknown protein [Cronobacter turicensis z3032]